MDKLNERICFFKSQWRKDHWWYYAAAVVLAAAVVVAGLLLRLWPVVCAALFVALGCYVFIYNKMMAFVEANAFDGSGPDKEEAPPAEDLPAEELSGGK